MKTEREATPADFARIDRSFKFLKVIAVPVSIASVWVLITTFLAWRAGEEGWRPGANVDTMLGAVTTLSLIASMLLLVRTIREHRSATTWRHLILPNALTLAAFVLLALRFR